MKLSKINLPKWSLWASTFVVFSVTVLTMFFSCSKDGAGDPTKIPRHSFFKNAAEASAMVQQTLSANHKGDILTVIESISYLSTKEKMYAFVYYKSTRGESNMAFEKLLVGDDLAPKSYSCDGDGCDCNVVVFTSGGQVNIHCSCPTCDLIVHPL